MLQGQFLCPPAAFSTFNEGGLSLSIEEIVRRSIILVLASVVLALASCMTFSEAQDPPKSGDPAPQAPKLDPPPTGEKTAEGLTFKVPYKRGTGSLTFSRQNGYLRVDADVRLLYNAGDGSRNQGSAVGLVLSVDGYHGRIFMHYPSPIWVPQEGMPAFRLEKSYSKESEPARLSEGLTFAASSNVCFSDHWTTTYWISLRRVITAGNTPDSAATTWRAAFTAGDAAMHQVFPEGLNNVNPAVTPDRMITFKVADLPEREAAKNDPIETIGKREDEIYRDLKGLIANFSLPRGASQAQLDAAFVKSFDALKVMVKAYPDSLLVRFLLWQIGLRISSKAEVDVLQLLRDYTEVCPSQLQVHLNYIGALIQAGRKAEAVKRIEGLLASDLAQGYPPALMRVRLDVAPLLIDAGEAAAAMAIYDEARNTADVTSDVLMGLRLAVGISRAAAALSDKGRESSALDLPKREPPLTQNELKPLMDYTRLLFKNGYEDEGVRAARILCESKFLTGDNAVFAQACFDCAAMLLTTGTEAARALALYDSVLKGGAFKDNDQARIGCWIGLAKSHEALGDMKTAAAVYSKTLEVEKEKLSAEFVGGIKQLLEFQTKGQTQWEAELLFIAEDAKKTNPRLTIETTKGTIIVELFEDDAPNTVASLVSLVQKNFYDGLSFHRFEPNFVIQGGDPKGDGSGDPGYKLKSEVNRRNHFMGTFAMACSQPKQGTEGSQFYICTSNGPNVLNLSGSYVVAGRVLEGLDVAIRLRAGDRMTKVTVGNLRAHEYKPETLRR